MEKPKIFKLGDEYWWAGYDLESCIADCENYFGEKVDPKDCYQLSVDEMRSLKVSNEDGEPDGTFEGSLNAMVLANQEFPCLFACTEW